MEVKKSFDGFSNENYTMDVLVKEDNPYVEVVISDDSGHRIGIDLIPKDIPVLISLLAVAKKSVKY